MKRLFSCLIIGMPILLHAAEMASPSLQDAQEYVAEVKKGSVHNVLSTQGVEVVSSADVAIQLAINAWRPIYGEKLLRKERPFVAYRVEEVWFVSGSIRKGWRGGAAEAVLRAKDGAFLVISHGK